MALASCVNVSYDTGELNTVVVQVTPYSGYTLYYDIWTVTKSGSRSCVSSGSLKSTEYPKYINVKYDEDVDHIYVYWCTDYDGASTEFYVTYTPTTVSFTIDDIIYKVENGSTATIIEYIGDSGASLTVTIPEYVKYNDNEYRVSYIDLYAFQDTYIGELVVPGDIDAHPAAFDRALIDRLTVSDGSVDVPSNWWYNVQILEIKLPDSISYLPPMAFYQISGLETIYLSDNITNIGPDTFVSCYKLSRIYLGNKLRVIESDAIRDCPSMYSLHFNMPSALFYSSVQIYGDDEYLRGLRYCFNPSMYVKVGQSLKPIIECYYDEGPGKAVRSVERIPRI